jgi:uncharacterized protein YciI
MRCKHERVSLMLFVVFFEDSESGADARRTHFSAHLEFLERHSAAVIAAGPTRDAMFGLPAGGLWLVQARSLTEVTEMVRADPLWVTGIRKSVRILQWDQVFSQNKRVAR